MSSLYTRIFLSFWAAMILIVLLSVLASTVIVQRRLEDLQDAHPWQIVQKAALVLQDQGRPGLERWLTDTTDALPGIRIFIVDEHDRELLGRDLPERARGRMRRMQRLHSREHRPGFRPPRLTSQLTGPDGETYRVLLLPRPSHMFGIFGVSGIPMVVLLVALAVSGILCLLLARYLSRPLGHLQNATRAVADGDLDTRVGAALGHRRDEFARLGHDFDAMAERLKTARENEQRMLRDISHELRSPLTRLQLALGLARRRAPGADKELDRVELEAERLNELIGEVLTLTRLDSHGTQVSFEPVDLAELIRELVANARLEAQAGDKTLECSLPEHLRVDAEQRLLASAIENVLRNAIRHTAPGSSVDISLEPGRDHASITVRDHGPGVGEGLLDRIFEPFYRVAAARERQTGGEGIGLAITRRVIDVHHGTVRARNHPEGGLEIVMSLPLGGARPAPG